MRKINIAAVLLVVLVMGAAQVAATNYYVRNAGNDSFDGKSPATAWKTLKNVNAQSFLPGDSILFERGGEWNESLVITSSGSSAGQITYSAYGTGDKPVFNGISEVSGWKTPGNWTNMGSNVWRINTWGTVYGRVWINGVEKERSRYGAEGVGITAQYPWQKINKRLYVYSANNPASTYTSLKMTSANDFMVNTSEKDYITIRHLEIRGWRVMTVRGCSHWIMEYCDFFESGHIALSIKINGSTYSSNGVIRHCDFDSKYPFYVSSVTGLDTGSPIYHGIYYGLEMRGGGFVNWDIHHNHFKSWGYGHFAFTNHKLNGYMTEGLKFHDNYIDGSEINYGRAFGGHHYLSQINENNPIEIYNNYIYKPAAPIQVGTPYLKIYNNIFHGAPGKDGVTNSVATAVEPFNFGDRPPYEMKIFNNVFAYCGYAGMFYRLSSGTDREFENVRVVNNIFYENGYGAKDIWHQFRISYFSTSAPLINPQIDNNIFYAAARTDVIYALATRMTVSQFNALDGTNAQQLNPKNNLYADPLFVDPENGDFRLQKNSPAIGAGLTPIAATDAAGNAWNNPPSIGPYEYSASTLVSESILPQSSFAPRLSTTRGAIVIEPGDSRTASIEVALYDGRGRRVSLLHDIGDKSLRIDTKALAPGVYTMQIRIDGRSYTRRIAVGGQRQVRM